MSNEMGIHEVMKALPHRYPFLMVDKIIECDNEKRIVGIKNLTFNEPFFQGHFPDDPVMPGVLQLEAMAQVGGVLINKMMAKEGVIAFFMAIDGARFRHVLRPGDVMRIEVEIIKARSKIAKVAGKVFCGDKLASEAELMFGYSEG